MLIILALLLFLVTLALYAELWAGFSRLGRVDQFLPLEGPAPPRVSVIVPACNEEAGIGPALRALCEQNYGNLEIIVVNDRSTDRTAEEIAAVKALYPRLRELHLTDLPAGWLGKTHALHRGAELAGGDYLLFTDGDVVLEPTTIARAMQAVTRDGLDHLALLFRNSTSGRLLNALIADGGAGLLLLCKPWLAELPKSRFFIGVGAFNLVRAETYRNLGGHRRLRLQVIDDLALGRLLKYGGGRQRCLRGENFVSVPWYDSLAQMYRGLMKNVFALFDHRYSLGLAGMALIIGGTVLPLAGAALTGGWARLLFSGCVLVRLAAIGVGLRSGGYPLGALPWLLVTPLISLAVIGGAMWSASWKDGIDWRGTRYPLPELRRQPWLLSGLFGRRR